MIKLNRPTLEISWAGWISMGFILGCLVAGYGVWRKGPGPLKWKKPEPVTFPAASRADNGP